MKANHGKNLLVQLETNKMNLLKRQPCWGSEHQRWDSVKTKSGANGNSEKKNLFFAV